ncbi:MAG: hypothetical protein AAF529_08880 [Pseudomonadota bacterium]
MDASTITEITDQLNDALDTSNTIRQQHGMPRNIQLKLILVARQSRREINALLLRQFDWNESPAATARDVEALAIQLESLPEMKLARACKILRGDSTGPQTYDVNTGKPQRTDAGGNAITFIAPGRITTDMVQQWADDMEAA